MLSIARTPPEVSFAELRAREFARLDRQELVYLDYTGSALYAESQIRAHHELLRDGLFGNPHSEHRPSRASTEVIDEARETVLHFLDVDARTHDVIFTANTTAAIKLVAESYPFAPDTQCILSVDNHNSVNGIREYARRAGAPVRYLPLDDELHLRDFELADGSGLFAFPAQSNFSGVRHPLSLVSCAKEAGYDVLLDIAGYVPSHAISLRDCPADFAALSFYKLFGYPTGLGALIVRREALARLRRPWFAGGTVAYASVHADTHRLRPRHDGFEDGTQNFLGIAALASGFALLEEVGMTRLSTHVEHLTSMFLHELTALPHVQIYGPRTMHDRGGTVAFNLCDRDGTPLPYSLVEARATAANIAVRGGCFCNPGAAEAALRLDPGHTSRCLTTLGANFTVDRFAACLDSPVGAVRVSIGLANNEEDIRRAIALLATFAE
ncbi:MAG TPA: aminotransferase class V-fold PLP-dependent enzyme [Thermoanaerobaculia bacterium]|nr:aminotransferase class V-fold PLP-dependent enzyme [Thermoanaerobaculia bacterium]